MHLMNFPVIVFILSFLGLWASARLGSILQKRRPAMSEAEQADLGVIVAAALTLLGLIIGFTFSMAITRYDQRKNYEEEEANAIGTEYLRIDLLGSPVGPALQQKLREYVDLRITYYQDRDPSNRRQLDAEEARLQAEMWRGVESLGRANPNPVGALAVSGMNDVLNTQGYTQAAWWNRIPVAAWALMFAIAIACNILIGYSAHQVAGRASRHVVFPLIVSIAFLLIADIDSPRGGIIRVHPQNLEALAKSLHP